MFRGGRRMAMELSVVTGRLKRARLVDVPIRVHMKEPRCAADYLLCADERGEIEILTSVDLLKLRGYNLQGVKVENDIEIGLKKKSCIETLAAILAQHANAIDVAYEHPLKKRGMSADTFLNTLGRLIERALEEPVVTRFLEEQGLSVGIAVVSEMPFLTMYIPIEYIAADVVAYWVEIDVWSGRIIFRNHEGRIGRIDQYHSPEATIFALKDFLLTSNKEIAN